MELRNYLAIIQKFWLMILMITLGITATSAAVTFAQTPQYQSSTELYVSVRSAGAGSGELVQGTNFARQVVASYVDMVTSDLVLGAVVNELELTESTQELSERISASTPSNTVLLEITATDPDPQEAARIANAVADSFIDVVENKLERPDDDSPSLVRLQTIQPALVASNPVSPNKKRNLALGAVIGIITGFSVAVLRKSLDTRVHSPTDLDDVIDVPLLGAILDDATADKQPLTVHQNPLSPRAEAFRTLRTNLQFLDVQGGPRTYVVSSASPSEGKTTTSINIALAFAETGTRVALIDADMRRPKVADYMGFEGGVGLSDVLIGRAELQHVAQKWGTTSLYVLPSGRVPPNPSELLGSSAMERLLATLHEHFEYVVIDSPPLLAVTDAAVVSKYSRGIILVAAAGRTHKAALRNAFDRIDAARSELLGVVMSRVPTKGPDSYGYGAYTYTYAEAPNGVTSGSRPPRHGRSRRARG